MEAPLLTFLIILFFQAVLVAGLWQAARDLRDLLDGAE